MSSSYSALIDYGSVKPYQPDFQLISTALQAKQTKLDTNRAKLQSYRDQLGVIDLAKDSDGEYLDMKLQQVTDISNQYANGDLSNDNLANSLISNMGQVLDANVKNAIIGTKILRNEQAEWTEKRKAKDGLYSDENYAFAMQRANNWMNDGQTGTIYNGGGGFIEYSDYQKKINDALPDIIKRIKSETKRPIAGAGPEDVGGIITEEEVNRQALKEAVEMNLNSKDLKQMQINGWTKYDKMPDEILKQDYENHMEPKILEAKERIKSLEALIATNPKQKAAYQTQLDSWKESKTYLETDASFDEVVKNGKSNIYSNLIKDQFVSSITDAYSYEPRVIDIKVNEIDSENRKFAETRRHNLETERVAALKVTKVTDTTKDLFIPGQEPILDTNPEVNTVYNRVAAKANRLEREIQGKLVKPLAEGGSGLSAKDAERFLDSKTYVALMTSNLAGKKSIQWEGKTIQITKALRDKVTAYRTDVHENKAFTKQYSEIDGALDEVQNSMRTGLATGNMAKYDVPMFNVQHKQLANGTWTIESINNAKFDPSLENRYIKLLNKKETKAGLSEAEEKDLKLYSTLHLLHDPNNTEGRRNFVKGRVIDLLKDVDQKGYSKIKLDAAGSKSVMPNTWTKTDRTSDVYISNYGKGDIESTLQRGKRYIGTSQYEAAKEYVESIDKQGIEKSGLIASNYANNAAIVRAYEEGKQEGPRSPIKIIDSRFKLIENNIESGLIREANLATVTPRIVTKAHKAEHEKLAGQLGIETSSTKDITISPEMKDGAPTGMLILSVKPSVNSKGEEVKGVAPVRVSADKLEALGVAKFDLSKNTRYDARLGNDAPKLKLGNGNYNEAMDKGFSKEVKDYILETAAINSNPKAVAEAQRLIKKYYNGDYEVQYESVGGIYRGKVYTESGNEVLPGFSFATKPIQILENNDASDLLESPKGEVDAIVSEMILKQLEHLENQ